MDKGKDLIEKKREMKRRRRKEGNKLNNLVWK